MGITGIHLNSIRSVKVGIGQQLMLVCFIIWGAGARAQTVPDINCAPGTFFAAVGNTIHKLQLNASSVTDLGVFATSGGLSTLNCVAYGNDIVNNSSNRTLYSSIQTFGFPGAILRYNGASWDTVATDSIVYHNGGGYGRFLYFQHSATSAFNNQCIARLNANGTLTKIFTDTTLRFTVADIAVDSTGSIYCFRGPAIGNTTEITKLDSNGVILNSYSTNLNNLTALYGSMLLNGTLYIGWGTTNNQIFPVIFSGNTAFLGTPLFGMSNFSKDLDSCHEPVLTNSVHSPEHDQSNFMVYHDEATGSLCVVNKTAYPFSIRVVDTYGRLLLSRTCVPGNNSYPVSNWSSGIHIVSLNGETAKAVYKYKIFKY